MKLLLAAVAALGLSAGAASAQSWEAVAASDVAVMAVDWSSLRVNGQTRGVNIALVSSGTGADAQFDYATSSIVVDCASARYQTRRSSFFRMDGTRAADDFEGEGGWEAINSGSLMTDMREQVCKSTASRPGIFDDPRTFALRAREVFAEQ